MIILYGQSGSGKTEWFKKKYDRYKIMHASDIEELRKIIQSSQSSLLDEILPILVNTWFDLDCKDIVDLINIDIIIETHLFETDNNIKTMIENGRKYYWGLKNVEVLRQINSKIIIYFPANKKTNKKKNMLEVFGTRYNWIKSQFPEVFE